MGWVKKMEAELKDKHYKALGFCLKNDILLGMAFVSLLGDLLAQTPFLCAVFIHHLPR